MRWLVGFAAFMMPVVLVLTAAAQSSMTGPVHVVMDQVAAVTLR
jgi:hypothetical protein